MGKIIKFPSRDDKVDGVKVFDPLNFFKKYAFLSLAILFVFSVVLNVTYQSRNGQARDVANIESSGDVNNLNDYILKSLSSSENNMEIVFSKKPNQEDKLIFETLVGSYDVQKSNGRISSIRLKSGYEPLKSNMLASVLTQYRRTLGISKLNFKMLKEEKLNAELFYSYELVSEQKTLGQMTITVNSNNEIVSIDTTFQ